MEKISFEEARDIFEWYNKYSNLEFLVKLELIESEIKMKSAKKAHEEDFHDKELLVAYEEKFAEWKAVQECLKKVEDAAEVKHAKAKKAAEMFVTATVDGKNVMQFPSSVALCSSLDVEAAAFMESATGVEGDWIFGDQTVAPYDKADMIETALMFDIHVRDKKRRLCVSDCLV